VSSIGKLHYSLCPATRPERQQAMRTEPKPRIVCNNLHSAHILEAARDGDVEALLRSDRPIASAVCSSGCRAIHWAAGNNQLSVLRFLLDGEIKGKKESAFRGALATLFRADDAASGPSRGRTALHYACRNGCFEAVRLLTEQYRANPNAQAKQNVTPFQMAVWRNHLEVAQYLVQRHGVDPNQVNNFACNAAHWACICPVERAGDEGELLIPLLEWLRDTCGADLFRAKQKQGHTPFHKACWLGHARVVEWLHVNCDMWDDQPDLAGNYGVDLCRMADTERHQSLEWYLRARCSRQPIHWCQALGVRHDEIRSLTDSEGNQEKAGETIQAILRKAYIEKIRCVHPDSKKCSMGTQHGDCKEFHNVRDAYLGLLNGGFGTQGNPNHQLPLLLRNSPEPTFSVGALNDKQYDDLTSVKSKAEPLSAFELPVKSPGIVVLAATSPPQAEDRSSFKARLLVVLKEYGDKGMNVSNLKKKWRQVWSDPFPDIESSGTTLSRYLSMHAGDVVTIHKNSKTGQVHVRARRSQKQQFAELGSRSLQ
jgi:ankyrin repeat protein